MSTTKIPENVFIHLGLHKTASTFFQKIFFQTYNLETGYLHLRTKGREFQEYLLKTNDLHFSADIAKEILERILNKETNIDNKITISDEVFAGNPWHNANERIRYFERLNSVFQDAKYIITFRNQEDLTQSLYLEYIKEGGSASWKQFLTYDGIELNFSRKAYLDFGTYYSYLKNRIGSNRILCTYYEDFKVDNLKYLEKIATYIGFKIDQRINEIINTKSNPSIFGTNAVILRHLNKFTCSLRQPFLLLPPFFHKVYRKLFLFIPSYGKNLIPKKEVKAFCVFPKERNKELPEYERIKKFGY